MSKRREGREWALQILFQLDANPPPPNDTLPDALFTDFWDGGIRFDGDAPPPPHAPPHIRDFTESLVRGAWAKRPQIDAEIEARVANWRMERIGGVERNVLRLGIYELLHSPDPQPRRVVINEAVDIAKYFGSNESGRFVNGVLDAVAKQHGGAQNAEEWHPAPRPDQEP